MDFRRICSFPDLPLSDILLPVLPRRAAHLLPEQPAEIAVGCEAAHLRDPADGITGLPDHPGGVPYPGAVHIFHGRNPEDPRKAPGALPAADISRGGDLLQPQLPSAVLLDKAEHGPDCMTGTGTMSAAAAADAEQN